MRRILTAAAALTAVALMVPTAGRAEIVQPDCTLDPPTGSTQLAVGDSCSAEFETTAAEAGYHVSIIGTHGGFHALGSGPGAYGKVQLDWKDSSDVVLASWSCRAFALRGDGEHEPTTVPACTELVAPPSPIPAGTHTMVATVIEYNAGGPATTRLHGRIVIRGDLI